MKIACEERKRLEEVYLNALRENLTAGVRIRHTNNETWLEATRETRATVAEALMHLESHRREHACGIARRWLELAPE